MKKLLLIFVIILNCSLLIFNCYSQWVQCSGVSPVAIQSCGASSSTIFVGTHTDGIFRSTDNGVSFSPTSLDSGWIWGITTSGSNIYAAVTNRGVLHSTDNGTTWSQTSYTFGEIYSIASYGSSVYAGVGGGVYLSTNNGSNWTLLGLTERIIHSIAVYGSDIYAGTHDFGVYYSSNNGQNWSQTNISGKAYSLIIDSNRVYVAISNTNYGTGGVYFTTNNGAIWTNIMPTDSMYFRSLAKSGNTLVAGTYNYGIFVTTNNGLQWFRKNQGFTGIPGNSSYIMTLLYFGNYFYAGTWGQSFWRRSSSEIIGINKISSEIPLAFSLEQNYPNPFNLMTNIKFQMLNAGNVKITVFDLLGKEVAILVNEKMETGIYQLKFDAATLPSGIYFYRMETDNFADTKKLTVLK